MPPALLLLREISTTTTSLASLVEKSQKCQPLLCYELQLTPTYLDLIPQKRQQQQQQKQQQQQHLKNDVKVNDEGFESDIDTVSVISSDDGSLVSTTTTTTTQETTQQQQQQQLKTTKSGETDSANGSASSDSDTSDHLSTTNNIRKYPTTTTTTTKESYNLVDCVCYSDVRVPDVLLFVIKQQVLVFKFENLLELHNFYLNFTAFKALTNQKTYNNNNNNQHINNIYNVGNSVNNLKISGKFNLLQRTDNNGVTHIEITREPEPELTSTTIQTDTTNIINLNTPNIDYNQNLGKLTDKSLTRNIINNNHNNNNKNNNNSLRKVWNSADDLLADSPKRPERRRRVKGKAPPPPIQQQQQSKTTQISDVLRGEYVRVNVNADTIKNHDFIAKSQLRDKPKSTNFVTLLTSKPKQPATTTTTTTTEQQLWMNSVPRLIKIKSNKLVQNSKLPPQLQPPPAPLSLRKRNETRYLPPMAYRYVDQLPTTQTTTTTTTNSISNRLFGLSSKLKDFNLETRIHSKWSSVGDISLKNDTNLKSVIKKDDNRKKNDKKVTFSAYTTVQVV